ncbi:MAG: (2Fe-2S)-binding protein [Pseudomonadota bacterium]
MYVCICNALKDRQVKAAATAPGTRTVACVFKAHGVRPRCGKCLPMVSDAVEEAKAGLGAAAIAAE